MSSEMVPTCFSPSLMPSLMVVTSLSPRRTAPAKLKTVVRQPVKKA